MLHIIFYEIVQISLASVFVAIVIIFVRCFLRKFPKIFSYVLWSVLLIRLLLPFSFEVSYRSIPKHIAHESVEEIITTQTTQVEYREFPIEEIQIKKPIYPYIWFAGMCILILYYLLAYISLRHRLSGAISYNQDEDIYLADYIKVPFVIGAMNPKIYLPSSLEETEYPYIIQHELCHIKRKDQIIKPLAVLALTIHWFNPFIWLAFFLSSKDMEMSCDEAVLRNLSEDEKKNYLASLVKIATGKKFFPALSIAFGEGDTKQRIKNAIKWKKSGIIKIVIALCITICVFTICLLIPKNKQEENPYNWIRKTDLGKLECEYVDEVTLRDVIYVIKELNISDFKKYTNYTAEIELEIRTKEHGDTLHLIYGDGVTVFIFNNNLSTGEIWGVENKNLALCMKEVRINREENIAEANYVEPWRPSRDAIIQMHEKIFAGVSEEDLDYITDLVKSMNMYMEYKYLYHNHFEDSDLPETFETYKLYVEGINKRLKNAILKADIEELLAYMDDYAKTPNIETYRMIYYKIHDLDYFLFRCWKDHPDFIAILDKSTISKYYGTLYIYDEVEK